MSAINRNSKKKNMNTTLLIGGTIALGAVLLFAYLMWYVEPEQTTEMVKVIAVTNDGCIAETLDGYSVNIGECQAQPGEYIDAVVDQKVKQRAAAMNPTT